MKISSTYANYPNPLFLPSCCATWEQAIQGLLRRPINTAGLDAPCLLCFRDFIPPALDAPTK